MLPLIFAMPHVKIYPQQSGTVGPMSCAALTLRDVHIPLCQRVLPSEHFACDNDNHFTFPHSVPRHLHCEVVQPYDAHICPEMNSLLHQDRSGR